VSPGVPVTLASLTSQITNAVADSGAYAIFGLMALDALLPVGGELVMLYAGALGAGAIAGAHATLFGAQLTSGVQAYLILSLVGALGYLVGSLAGWAIGARGGRGLIERHGRWLYVSPQAFQRAERWFERFGHRAVFCAPSYRSPRARSAARPRHIRLSPSPARSSGAWASPAPAGRSVTVGTTSTTTSATPTTPPSPSLPS
jgi:hypothetical protein